MTCYEIDGVVPVIDPAAFVHPSAVLIGDVIVGPGCYIGPSASLRGDFGRIVVGEGSNVQDSCVLHAFPGADCELAPHSHLGHGAIVHGARVGSYAMVGMNAVVMDGCVLGDDALVGACSFVRAGTEVPPRTLVVGNPARVVRELDEQAIAWKRNGVHTYQELAERSRVGLRPVEPLTAVEPDRRRVSTDSSVATPLHRLRAGASDPSATSAETSTDGDPT
ncbi:MAG: transferase hexapeptide repeat family protein [Nocardioides sp.]|uniref:acyltransferase n=1 Tax=Nocardioides sp. TaxID=35761 RepID=UPI0039E37734